MAYPQTEQSRALSFMGGFMNAYLQGQQLNLQREQMQEDRLYRQSVLELKRESVEMQRPLFEARAELAGAQALFPGKPAAAGERTSIAEARASEDSLNNLLNLYDDEFVGPATGRIAPTAGLFGRTTTKQENFMAATSAFKNAIIKQITGAQMSEPEAKRIMKQVPDITDPPERWNAKWQQSLRNVQSMKKRKLEVLRQSGVTTPGDIKTRQDLNMLMDLELLGSDPLEMGF